MRARCAPFLRHAGEQRRRLSVVEGQEREPAAIEARGDTRREAAEASIAVV